MTTIKIEPAFNTSPVKRFPKKAIAEPNPSIRGTVPMLKQNMENAPASRLPDASAMICTDCNGPHGISPLHKPIIKGVFLLFPTLLYKRGIRIRNFRSHGKIPSILIPITIITVPAASFRIPWISDEVCRSVPNPASPPTAPRIPPTTV